MSSPFGPIPPLIERKRNAKGKVIVSTTPYAWSACPTCEEIRLVPWSTRTRKPLASALKSCPFCGGKR